MGHPQPTAADIFAAGTFLAIRTAAACRDTKKVQTIIESACRSDLDGEHLAAVALFALDAMATAFLAPALDTCAELGRDLMPIFAEAAEAVEEVAR